MRLSDAERYAMLQAMAGLRKAVVLEHDVAVGGRCLEGRNAWRCRLMPPRPNWAVIRALFCAVLLAVFCSLPKPFFLPYFVPHCGPLFLPYFMPYIVY